MLLNSLTEDKHTPLVESPCPRPFLFVENAFFKTFGAGSTNREVLLSAVYCAMAANLIEKAGSLERKSKGFQSTMLKSYHYFMLAKSCWNETLDPKNVHPMLTRHFEHFYCIIFEILYWDTITTIPPGVTPIPKLEEHLVLIARIYTAATEFRQ